MSLVSRNDFFAMTPAVDANNGIEFGNQRLLSNADLESRPSLVLASYNIRYAVGRYLISSGLLRKVGVNLPRRRAEAVSQNIETAAKAFSDNVLLPAPDILALQEADKRTGRACSQHVAAQVAELMN